MPAVCSCHGNGDHRRIIDRVCREFSWMKEEIPYVRIEHVTDPEEESLRKAAEHNIAVVTQPVFMYAEVEVIWRTWEMTG